jgi:CheY-like chemotaxis protein
MSPASKVLDGWLVLVVDDEPDNLDVVRRMLTRLGAQVVMAENGVEALGKVQQHNFDFILADLSMPQMDGWTLIKELNHNPATTHIPVIALTAHAMLSDRDRVLEAGFVNYMTKPLEVDKFIATLLSMISDIPALAARLS